MHHMVFLNPRRSSSPRRRVKLARRSNGRFVRKSPVVVKINPARRRSRTARTISFVQPKSIMRTRSFRRRRRVRRNPPAMTAARKALIGRKIRALHRAGKYKRSRPARSARRSITRRSSARRSAPSFARRVGGRRRSVRRRSIFRGMAMGGGALGMSAFLSKDNLMLAGGAIGSAFACNYACSIVCSRLPASIGTNPFAQAAVKLATAALLAKLASRVSRPLAHGIIIGGIIVVANDAIKKFMPSMASPGTAQYLGQYLSPGRPVASLVGPVSAARKTFAPGVGGLYGGGSAFAADAWAR